MKHGKFWELKFDENRQLLIHVFRAENLTVGEVSKWHLSLSVAESRELRNALAEAEAYSKSGGNDV